MPTGSCVCGNIRYEFTGEPEAKVVCHCHDCQKTSGAPFTINALISNENFKVTSGTPSGWTKTADSGSSVTNFFCPNCGSTSWGETKAFEGMKILRAGTLDHKSDLDNIKPTLELYKKNRSSWLPAFEGTEQHDEM